MNYNEEAANNELVDKEGEVQLEDREDVTIRTHNEERVQATLRVNTPKNVYDGRVDNGRELNNNNEEFLELFNSAWARGEHDVNQITEIPMVSPQPKRRGRPRRAQIVFESLPISDVEEVAVQSLRRSQRRQRV